MDFRAARAFKDTVLEFRVNLLFHFLFSGGKLKQITIAHKLSDASKNRRRDVIIQFHGADIFIDHVIARSETKPISIPGEKEIASLRSQ